MSLDRILSLARALETSWPALDRQTPRDLSLDPKYRELREQVAAHPDPRLNRFAAHLTDQIRLAHFYGCIVPFERLAAKARRDDEFLIDEQDRREALGERLPLKLIAENIRSAFNVGALFRTADCLGASEILLCGYTPGPDDDKTSRTSMGASAHVPWRRMDRALSACEELRREGYQIIALETAEPSTPLHALEFRGPTAFVIGNERFGINSDTLKMADGICRIPVRGVKNSMNVGIAFGVAAYEWLRQYEATK